MILLSTAYFPSIQHFTKLLLNQPVIYDYGEHFLKQSYRNRCTILGANGPLDIVVPVHKKWGHKTPVKDIEIDYSEKWQKDHFKAIESAYKSSPYYEYYIDDFNFIFHEKVKRIVDLNERIIHTFAKLLDLNIKWQSSSNYIDYKEALDYRISLSPKIRLQQEDTLFMPQAYFQVFNTYPVFTDNLSVLDLLFNEGPNAEHILRSSIRSENPV